MSPFTVGPFCGDYLILCDLLLKVTWFKGPTNLTLLHSPHIYICVYVYIETSVVGKVLIFLM